MKSRITQGFTLIEVMIVVAIVAILASVALPAYTDYLRRGRMPEAFTYLSDYGVKMEQYYQDNRRYGTGNCGSGTAYAAWNTFAPVGAKYFNFSCTLTGTNDQGFTLTAAGKTGTSVANYIYTLDQTRLKKTIKFANSTVDKSCWATKLGDC